LATDLGAEPTPDALDLPKRLGLIAARAAGILPLGFIGTVAGLKDLDGYRAMLRRSQGRTQTVWIHAGLEHDPSTKVTRWQGQAVELTRREMSLLETFLMNPTKVWSKSQLQSKLYDWGDSEPESNALEVHIHHLRKKIHPNIVRNIRGVGYVLGSEGLLT
jgi:DNA-binding response OmpR family regulator